MDDYSAANFPPSVRYLNVPADCAGLRIDQALARLMPEHSRNRLQSWLRDGLILVDGGGADPKRKVWGGEALSVSEPRAGEHSEALPENIPIDIVFEDDALLVINKAVGLVVHPGSGNWTGTLLNALLHHDGTLASVPRAGIVHRLDKDTSGLLVVARSLQAQTELVRQLQARSVKRHYVALVLGDLAGAGTVNEPIGRHPTQRTRMAVVPAGKPAVTHFEVRKRFGHSTLVECRLETGRTHQIRVHMAHIGHPLVGDETYGRRRAAEARLCAFPRQALHAYRLGFMHPVTRRECMWEVPMAHDMDDLLCGLEAA
ncbi:23S rRNA pseudouridine(1911/1915/1917) synthase RluD [Cognatazoarcus halotolerans]|uniref:23S rRNA pseudouridine(1911/1915/1917) synthase RluD n=1 Tax=Cognatazoarcus halotolerans TaxID=2686016 RepID=UPI002285E2F4|nr:23S rRNA pseudouridine(1911/1915/1917) synthase RluD [Cognatazoarcus halotolerans]